MREEELRAWDGGMEDGWHVVVGLDCRVDEVDRNEKW